MTSPSTDVLVRTSAAVAAPPVTVRPPVGSEPVADAHGLRPDLPELTSAPEEPSGPAVPGTRLIRFRTAVDHDGLRLRAGETVLCVPYEPAELGMVVLVRCESDGHAPGALLSVRGLVYVEEAGQYSDEGAWDDPGRRGAALSGS